jgi:hypothetical protein
MAETTTAEKFGAAIRFIFLLPFNIIFFPFKMLGKLFQFLFLKNATITAILITFILILIAAGFFAYRYYNDSQKRLNLVDSGLVIPPTPSAKETAELVDKVGKLMRLPEGNPQIVTITNVETLKKDQPFFEHADNGFKLLIYSNKVILYDPFTNKVIETAQIKPTSMPTPDAQPTLKQSFNVLLLNGTSSPSAIINMENKLKTNPDLKIIRKDIARFTTYLTSTISDISIANPQKFSEISENLSLKIAPLSKNEASPSSDIDIVIIAGSDAL